MHSPDSESNSLGGHSSVSQSPPLGTHTEAEFRSLLAAIVESSDDAVISKNTQGVITSWNHSAERIFGYTAREAIGRSITLISIPGREAEIQHLLARILAGERINHYETVRRHKDGHQILVSLTVSPVRNQYGAIIGASKIARDITAQKKTDQVLQQTEKLATLGRLSATIAHEINNPLESLTNLLFLLRHDSLSSQGLDYLQMAELELARISHIVTQKLTFHKQNTHPRPNDVAAILDSALSFLTHRLHSHPIDLVRKYRPAPPVSCLDGELRQLFLNLIGNALDATRQASPARLILALRPATEWKTGRLGIRVTVADNGCGIPSSDIPRIFEAFFTTKNNSGNGLGLWVSSEIIQRHQGSISVRSTLRGTVFAVFLPLASQISSFS